MRSSRACLPWKRVLLLYDQQGASAELTQPRAPCTTTTHSSPTQVISAPAPPVLSLSTPSPPTVPLSAQVSPLRHSLKLDERFRLPPTPNGGEPRPLLHPHHLGKRSHPLLHVATPLVARRESSSTSCRPYSQLPPSSCASARATSRRAPGGSTRVRIGNRVSHATTHSSHAEAPS